MDFPFKETLLGDNQYIREFSKDSKTDELEWHLDKEDRIVEVIENNGWQYQEENKLPVLLEGKIFVPKETYHRVIKGNGDLKIKLTKIKNS